VATQTKTRTARASKTSAARTNGDGAVVSAADLQPLLDALRAAARGEHVPHLDTRKRGIVGQLNKAFNQKTDARERIVNEIVRVSTVIGREGRLTDRANVKGSAGVWRESLNAVNSMIDDLSRPTLEVARVIDAVAEGDLSQKMQLKIEGRAVKGEFLRIGTTVNSMVDQLSSFADEVTRVAREVGTEGKLGGQATVKGVSGTWKDLTDNVNGMATNLTNQVRNIAEVTTAVANGDLTRKITVDVKGEVLELKNTINTMVDQLSIFADEVTRVAREAGTEGKLGGQAVVKGVGGTWKDLTDNVNLMVSNLTTQVRGVAQVVTAVADGDLNRKFTIEAKGEVAALAETVNSMVDRLRVFSSEVTRVAREVGSDGKLGGAAEACRACGAA
jgi:HAMP domain-containing protein